MTFVINERMPYSHSHRVAWPRPKTGDSVLLTFDFRSSRRGGRHHVRLEYQLPIRSENGTTSRSYSVIQLKVTHYYRSRLNTIRPPTPPARPSVSSPERPYRSFSARASIQVNDCPLIVAELQLAFFTCRHTRAQTHPGRLTHVATRVRMYIRFNTVVHTRAHECASFPSVFWSPSQRMEQLSLPIIQLRVQTQEILSAIWFSLCLCYVCFATIKTCKHIPLSSLSSRNR